MNHSQAVQTKTLFLSKDNSVVLNYTASHFTVDNLMLPKLRESILRNETQWQLHSVSLYQAINAY